MRGGGEKPQKSDALRAVIQPGELGFFPFNSLGVTAMLHGQADCLISTREDPFIARLRNQTEFVVGEHTIPLKNNVFNGICDAFYRGKLPELIFVTSDMASIPSFIEEFMDFLEKLCSLGFLTQHDSDKIAILDRYVPQLIIGTYGVVYDVILEKLDASIDNLGALSVRQKDRLLQKITRGMFTSPVTGYDLLLTPPMIFDQPISINLAGSKSMYTVRTNQLLDSHQIACNFNPNGELGILEWEMNLAYRHIIHRVLPLLEDNKVKPDITPEQVSALMDTTGQKMGILPGMVVLSDALDGDVPRDKLCLSAVDMAILHQVKLLSQDAEVTELTTLMETLITLIKPLLRSSSSLMPAEQH
jgi:hypothetical protein